jgi:phenylalanyl-tRNA synthetase beta chain
MRVPLSWLREYCDPPLGTPEIAGRLNLSGTEVGRIERAGVPDGAGFVVGKVRAAERHPDADRLSVCEVDDGSGTPRTIVCGSPNVAAGQTVAVALPGATMPDGGKLGEAKLRGIVSSGMILAEDEVGIGEDHAGIMVLPDDLPAGAPLAEHLAIADEVLDLEIAPNRPDCLGVQGVAREVHAATGAPLAIDDADVEPAGDAGFPIEVADPEICLRFTARVFEDVTVGPSPLWLKARLAAAGQRPISNVVDITNYVMLATGQPLHAFDLDRIRGGRIVVRRAREGETMTTLDGAERSFSSETALVCDAEGPSGIAGIMGGEVSEVAGSTTRVLMEAATWVGPNILRSSARLGLRTEASARFEKQLHPDQAAAAQQLAARLMVELCGARLVSRTIDAYPRPVEATAVVLRPARVARLLGTEIPADEIRAILERLGFAVADGDGDGGAFSVTVPPWRWSDVYREADLVEEVGRVYGLDRMPVTLPARRRAVGRLTPAQRLRRRLEDALRDRGLAEAVSYSFTSPATLERLRLDHESIRISNPLSEEQSVMRPLLLAGLLDAARHNAARGRPGARLFESAHVFPGPLAPPAGGASDTSPNGAVPAPEPHHLAVLLTGPAPAGWRIPAAPADFYAAKGLLEAVLDAAGVPARFEPGERPFLHPGRSASVVTLDGRELGYTGEVHPAVLADWDLDGGAAFEVDADLLSALAPAATAYRDVTSFPAVLQDIAVVVPEDLPAAEVDGAVRAGGGELLSQLRLFDVYRGEQVGEGEKSLALRLEFRAPDRTLTDEDVAGLRGAIEERLAAIGGRLRA